MVLHHNILYCMQLFSFYLGLFFVLRPKQAGLSGALLLICFGLRMYIAISR